MNVGNLGLPKLIGTVDLTMYIDNVYSAYVHRHVPVTPEFRRMNIHSPKEIAGAVREARRTHRLSQAALATRIGASRQWVQRLEGGAPGVELGLTLRALLALGIRLDLQHEDGSATSDVVTGQPTWIGASAHRRRKPRARVPHPVESHILEALTEAKSANSGDHVSRSTRYATRRATAAARHAVPGTHHLPGWTTQQDVAPVDAPDINALPHLRRRP